ncbi:unnamed protein product [Notodromas monacha]|uniref:Peptidase S1 domain-containing protein n=1 Tax=Notodromas monacha TaxID=399045 RepID=A0A7R9BFA9_9CRUS|nr:unnamed protein product [Notodromas monacha]CAG0913753.1 unnamed protein product [Notodromas monacha]
MSFIGDRGPGRHGSKKPPPPPPPMPPPPNPRSTSTFRPPPDDVSGFQEQTESSIQHQDVPTSSEEMQFQQPPASFMPPTDDAAIDSWGVNAGDWRHSAEHSSHAAIADKQDELLRAKSMHRRQTVKHGLDGGFSYINTVKKAKTLSHEEEQLLNNEGSRTPFGYSRKHRHSNRLMSSMKAPKSVSPLVEEQENLNMRERAIEPPRNSRRKSSRLCWVIAVTILAALLGAAVVFIAVLLVRDRTPDPPHVIITNTFDHSSTEKHPGEAFFESDNELPALLSREKLPEAKTEHLFLSRIKLDTLNVSKEWNGMKSPASKIFAKHVEEFLSVGLKDGVMTAGDVKSVKVDNFDPVTREIFLSLKLNRPHFADHVNYDIAKAIQLHNGFMLAHRVNYGDVKTSDVFRLQGMLDVIHKDTSEDIDHSRMGLELSHLIRSTAKLNQKFVSMKLVDFSQGQDHVVHLTYNVVFNQIVSVTMLESEVLKTLEVMGGKLGPYPVKSDSVRFRDISNWSNEETKVSFTTSSPKPESVTPLMTETTTNDSAPSSEILMAAGRMPTLTAELSGSLDFLPYNKVARLNPNMSSLRAIEQAFNKLVALEEWHRNKSKIQHQLLPYMKGPVESIDLGRTLEEVTPQPQTTLRNFIPEELMLIPYSKFKQPPKLLQSNPQSLESQETSKRPTKENHSKHKHKLPKTTSIDKLFAAEFDPVLELSFSPSEINKGAADFLNATTEIQRENSQSDETSALFKATDPSPTWNATINNEGLNRSNEDSQPPGVQLEPVPVVQLEETTSEATQSSIPVDIRKMSPEEMESNSTPEFDRGITPALDEFGLDCVEDATVATLTGGETILFGAEFEPIKENNGSISVPEDVSSGLNRKSEGLNSTGGFMNETDSFDASLIPVLKSGDEKDASTLSALGTDANPFLARASNANSSREGNTQLDQEHIDQEKQKKLSPLEEIIPKDFESSASPATEIIAGEKNGSKTEPDLDSGVKPTDNRQESSKNVSSTSIDKLFAAEFDPVLELSFTPSEINKGAAEFLNATTEIQRENSQSDETSALFKATDPSPTWNATINNEGLNRSNEDSQPPGVQLEPVPVVQLEETTSEATQSSIPVDIRKMSPEEMESNSTLEFDRGITPALDEFGLDCVEDAATVATLTGGETILFGAEFEPIQENNGSISVPEDVSSGLNRKSEGLNSTGGFMNETDSFDASLIPVLKSGDEKDASTLSALGTDANPFLARASNANSSQEGNTQLDQEHIDQEKQKKLSPLEEIIPKDFGSSASPATEIIAGENNGSKTEPDLDSGVKPTDNRQESSKNVRINNTDFNTSNLDTGAAIELKSDAVSTMPPQRSENTGIPSAALESPGKDATQENNNSNDPLSLHMKDLNLRRNEAANIQHLGTNSSEVGNDPIPEVKSAHIERTSVGSMVLSNLEDGPDLPDPQNSFDSPLAHLGDAIGETKSAVQQAVTPSTLPQQREKSEDNSNPGLDAIIRIAGVADRPVDPLTGMQPGDENASSVLQELLEPPQKIPESPDRIGTAGSSILELHVPSQTRNLTELLLPPPPASERPATSRDEIINSAHDFDSAVGFRSLFDDVSSQFSPPDEEVKQARDRNSSKKSLDDPPSISEPNLSTSNGASTSQFPPKVEVADASPNLSSVGVSEQTLQKSEDALTTTPPLDQSILQKFVSIPSASLQFPSPPKEGTIIDSFTFEATVGGDTKIFRDETAKKKEESLPGPLPSNEKAAIDQALDSPQNAPKVFRPKLFRTLSGQPETVATGRPSPSPVMPPGILANLPPQRPPLPPSVPLRPVGAPIPQRFQPPGGPTFVNQQFVNRAPPAFFPPFPFGGFNTAVRRPTRESITRNPRQYSRPSESQLGSQNPILKALNEPRRNSVNELLERAKSLDYVLRLMTEQKSKQSKKATAVQQVRQPAPTWPFHAEQNVAAARSKRSHPIFCPADFEMRRLVYDPKIWKFCTDLRAAHRRFFWWNPGYNRAPYVVHRPTPIMYKPSYMNEVMRYNQLHHPGGVPTEVPADLEPIYEEPQETYEPSYSPHPKRGDVVDTHGFALKINFPSPSHDLHNLHARWKRDLEGSTNPGRTDDSFSDVGEWSTSITKRRLLAIPPAFRGDDIFDKQQLTKRYNQIWRAARQKFANACPPDFIFRSHQYDWKVWADCAEAGIKIRPPGNMHVQKFHPRNQQFLPPNPFAQPVPDTFHPLSKQRFQKHTAPPPDFPPHSGLPFLSDEKFKLSPSTVPGTSDYLRPVENRVLSCPKDLATSKFYGPLLASYCTPDQEERKIEPTRMYCENEVLLQEHLFDSQAVHYCRVKYGTRKAVEPSEESYHRSGDVVDADGVCSMAVEVISKIEEALNGDELTECVKKLLSALADILQKEARNMPSSSGLVPEMLSLQSNLAPNSVEKPAEMSSGRTGIHQHFEAPRKPAQNIIQTHRKENSEQQIPPSNFRDQGRTQISMPPPPSQSSMTQSQNLAKPAPALPHLMGAQRQKVIQAQGTLSTATSPRQNFIQILKPRPNQNHITPVQGQSRNNPTIMSQHRPPVIVGLSFPSQKAAFPPTNPDLLDSAMMGKKNEFDPLLNQTTWSRTAIDGKYVDLLDAASPRVNVMEMDSGALAEQVGPTRTTGTGVETRPPPAVQKEPLTPGPTFNPVQHFRSEEDGGIKLNVDSMRTARTMMRNPDEDYSGFIDGRGQLECIFNELDCDHSQTYHSSLDGIFSRNLKAEKSVSAADKHIADEILSKLKSTLNVELIIENSKLEDAEAAKETAARSSDGFLTSYAHHAEYHQIKRCNGIVEHPSGADEYNCTCVERVDWINSASMPRNVSRLCDGTDDCPDGSDETGCAYTHGLKVLRDCPPHSEKHCVKCPPKHRLCIDSDDRTFDAERHCYSKEETCDGAHKCKNGEDERVCFAAHHVRDATHLLYGLRGRGYMYRRVSGLWHMICVTDGKSFDAAAAAAELCRQTMGVPSEKVTPRIIPLPKNYTGQFVGYINRSWAPTTCPSKLVYQIQCDPPKCGYSGEVRHRRTVSSIITDDDPMIEKYREKGSPIRNQDRIVGGVASKAGRNPHMCAIWHGPYFSCGGTILSEKFILTAAHCFFIWISPTKLLPYQTVHYRVMAGNLRRFSNSPSTQYSSLEYVIPSEEYSGAASSTHYYSGDIAIGVLKNPLYFNRWVHPICLPPPNLPKPDGVECRVMGWGHTQYNGVSPDTLHEVYVKCMGSCKYLAEMNYVDDATMLCAGWLGEGGKDACAGDSGGALICPLDEDEEQWYIVGVVSHGKLCAMKNFPGVYTLVSAYLPWIRKVLTGAINYKEGKYATKSECSGVLCQRTGICIHPGEVCDKKIDCLLDVASKDEFEACNLGSIKHGSKPAKIGNTCGPGKSKCKSGSHCYTKRQLCNAVPDCPDKTDEIGCTCGDYLQAFPEFQSLVCDGITHCFDGSDESRCKVENDTIACERSPDNKRIGKKLICNGAPDCPNGEDEVGCYSITADPNEIIFDSRNKAIPMQSGIVLSWKSPFTIASYITPCFKKFAPPLTVKICEYLGFDMKGNLRVRLGHWKPSMPVKTSFEQVIPINGLKILQDEKIALLHMESVPHQSDAVIPICLPDALPQKKTMQCYIGGIAKGKIEFVNITATPCEHDMLCLSYASGTLPCMAKWGSALSCATDAENPTRWEAIAVFEAKGTCATQELPSKLPALATATKRILETMLLGPAPRIEAKPCESGDLMSYGICVPKTNQKDGIPHSHDLMDEVTTTDVKTERFCDVAEGFDTDYYGCGKSYFGAKAALTRVPRVLEKDAHQECESGYFTCASGKCIPQEKVCDQMTSFCDDGSDQVNCDCVGKIQNRTWSGSVCDGIQDCYGYEDEKNSQCGVPENHQRCISNPKNTAGSSESVHYTKLCDGVQDCQSGEDEQNRMCFAMTPESHVPLDPIGYPVSQNPGIAFARQHGIWAPLPAANFTMAFGHVICSLFKKQACEFKVIPYPAVDSKFTQEYLRSIQVQTAPFYDSVYLTCCD